MFCLDTATRIKMPIWRCISYTFYIHENDGLGNASPFKYGYFGYLLRGLYVPERGVSFQMPCHFSFELMWPISSLNYQMATTDRPQKTMFCELLGAARTSYFLAFSLFNSETNWSKKKNNKVNYDDIVKRPSFSGFCLTFVFWRHPLMRWKKHFTGKTSSFKARYFTGHARCSWGWSVCQRGFHGHLF